MDGGLISHHYWVADGQLETLSPPFRDVWPSELDLMARLAGMTLRERWSDWNRAPFTNDSTMHVSVWEKTAWPVRRTPRREWPRRSDLGGDVTQQPSLKLTAPVFDAPDPRALAEFYGRLLGWTIGTDEPDWVTLRAPDGVRGLSFQLEKAYVRPTWPAGPGDQQMQVHLDIEVDDLEAAGAYAVALGAVLADHQPQKDVRVCFDPVGHPFCLWLGG